MRNKKMNGKKTMFMLLLLLLQLQFSAKAQVGYQVSLLNTATGEPQANVSVNATATITNSANEVIWTGTKPATSNEFGVISLTVGDKDTFKNIDTGKLPLFIEVQVNGAVIGKSQILTVPVAEIAGTLKSSFTLEDLVGTWIDNKWEPMKTIFYSDYSVKTEYLRRNEDNGFYLHRWGTGFFEIEGNNIYVYIVTTDDPNWYSPNISEYRWYDGVLYAGTSRFTKQ